MPHLKRGYLFAIAGYGLWGITPLYWKLLRPTGAVEILAHRFLWSLVLVTILLAVLRRFSALRPLFRDRRKLLALSFAGVVIAINWGTYIFTVNSGHVVEAALGYFMNPLVTVLMGVIVLHERLRAAQWTAVAVGASAVVILTIDYGRPPWLALVLAFSFATYGLAKKKLSLPAVEGLFAESLVVVVPAVAFLAWMQAEGSGGFASISLGHTLLLIGGGVATAVPLLFFAGAANRLPMAALGMCQYLAPSLQFGIGVLVFGEPMPTVRLIGFGLVWVALIVFSYDLARHRRQSRVPEQSSTEGEARLSSRERSGSR